MWSFGGTYSDDDKPSTQDAYKTFFLVSLASEVLFEAIPQCILQMINNEHWNSWTMSSLFSSIVSVTMAVNALYFLSYCFLYRKMFPAEVYERMSAFGGHGLEVTNPHIQGITKELFLCPRREAIQLVNNWPLISKESHEAEWDILAERLWYLLMTSFLSTSMGMNLIMNNCYSIKDLKSTLQNRDTVRIRNIINHAINLAENEGCGLFISGDNLMQWENILELCMNHQKPRTLWGILSALKIMKWRNFKDLALPQKCFTQEQYEIITTIIDKYREYLDKKTQSNNHVDDDNDPTYAIYKGDEQFKSVYNEKKDLDNDSARNADQGISYTSSNGCWSSCVSACMGIMGVIMFVLHTLWNCIFGAKGNIVEKVEELYDNLQVNPIHLRPLLQKKDFLEALQSILKHVVEISERKNK
jgi:hypothetical protein